MDEPYKEFSRLAKAGTHAVHLVSYEWSRVESFCLAAARDLGVPMRSWSESGSRRWPSYDSEVEQLEPLDLLDVLQDHAASPEGEVLLLEDVHPHLDPVHNFQVVRWVRQVCRLPREPSKLVVLSAPFFSLPPELEKEVPTLELPLPDVQDLHTVAAHVAKERGVQYVEDPFLVEAARGLTVMEASLAFGQAVGEHGVLGPEAVGMVLREKERVIKQSQVLEHHAADAGMADVGGLDHLKIWLERRRSAFRPEAKAFGVDSPKGVLLLGVQGCGKSLTAKAIAATWQFPLLRFDLGKVFGGIVGQSEANIRKALAVADALAPCVLWIDEIEKGLSGMGSSDRSDGGTTARVVGSLLTWMQEKQRPVFVVATANRIDMLPPELLRKGRFDEIFFVDLPTEAVRREILDIHLKRKNHPQPDEELHRLATASVGFSGAELEEAVREGLIEAFADGRDLASDDVLHAIESTVPLSTTMAEHIEDLRNWAAVRARAASSEAPEAMSETSLGKRVPLLPQEAVNPFKLPPVA